MATKTFEELKQLAIQIRDEKTNKQNTATRIGTQMLEHLDKLEQDYYDKTATDEELKERDEKLTELEKESVYIKSNIKNTIVQTGIKLYKSNHLVGWSHGRYVNGSVVSNLNYAKSSSLTTDGIYEINVPESYKEVAIVYFENGLYKGIEYISNNYVFEYKGQVVIQFFTEKEGGFTEEDLSNIGVNIFRRSNARLDNLLYNSTNDTINNNAKLEEANINVNEIQVQWVIGGYSDTGSNSGNISSIRINKLLLTHGIYELDLSGLDDYLREQCIVYYTADEIFEKKEYFNGNKVLLNLDVDKYVGFASFKQDFTQISEDDLNILNSLSHLYKYTKRDIDYIEKLRKSEKTEFKNAKWSVGNSSLGNNSSYFVTSNKLSLRKGDCITYNNQYLKIEIATFNNNVCESLNDIDNIHYIEKDGEYAIQGYIRIGQITEDELKQVSEDIIINKIPFAWYNDDNKEDEIPYLQPKVNNNSIRLENVNRNIYKYPLIPIWGYEYMYSWYKKIYEGGDGVTTINAVLAGDSIMEGSAPLYPQVNDTEKGMRDKFLKRIMKIGGFPMERFRVVNTAHGGKTTNEFVGNEDSNAGADFPYGYLHNAMGSVTQAFIPHLLIIGYGMNDANRNYSTKTIEERLQVYKDNMTEALERIRGNVEINGRPAYNKPLSELSIIICNPTVANIESTGRSNVLWFEHLRIINMELCRKYYCAFVDFTARTYDHKNDGSNYWATLNSDGTYGNIHPNRWADASIFSMIQELIFPCCMWNVEVE